jgi:hypothetical protein
MLANLKLGHSAPKGLPSEVFRIMVSDMPWSRNLIRSFRLSLKLWR